MLLGVLSLHKHTTAIAGNQRVVPGLQGVEVEVSSSGLERYVRALAHFIGDLILVCARRIVKVSVELEGAFLDVSRLFGKHFRRQMFRHHVLLELRETLKADSWHTIGAAELEISIDLNNLS